MKRIIPCLTTREWIAMGFSIALFLLSVLILFVSSPSTASKIRRATVTVRQRHHCEIIVNGKPIACCGDLFSDSLSHKYATKPQDSVIIYSTGIWIDRFSLFSSSRGRVLTVLPKQPHLQINGYDFLRLELKKLRDKQKVIHQLNAETQYYIRVHQVHEYGYNTVAEYGNMLRNRERMLKKVIKAFEVIKPTDEIRIVRKSDFTVFYYDKSQQPSGKKCRLYAVSDDNNAVLLQTADRRKPSSAPSIAFNSGNGKLDGEVVFAGHPALNYRSVAKTDAKTLIYPAKITNGHHHVPALIASEGTVVFTPNGLFIGIVSGRNIIQRDAIRRLFRKQSCQ